MFGEVHCSKLALLGFVVFMPSSEASLYVARLCRNHACTDPNYPILDYIKGESKCVCRAHPCWEDNGIVHSCPNEEAKYLRFSYTDKRELTCGCSPVPAYGSVYISMSICP